MEFSSIPKEKLLETLLDPAMPSKETVRLANWIYSHVTISTLPIPPGNLDIELSSLVRILETIQAAPDCLANRRLSPSWLLYKFALLSAAIRATKEEE